jgi:hypothetical protein
LNRKVEGFTLSNGFSGLTGEVMENSPLPGNPIVFAVVATNEPPTFNWAPGPNRMPLGFIKKRLALP